MYLTDGAAQAFAAAFDLPSSLLPTVQGTKFGALAVDVTAAAAPVVVVPPPIPEPSTYALMGLGLVGIAFAARKRAA
jgi:PEP-CTERM motif